MDPLSMDSGETSNGFCIPSVLKFKKEKRKKSSHVRRSKGGKGDAMNSI